MSSLWKTSIEEDQFGGETEFYYAKNCVESDRGLRKELRKAGFELTGPIAKHDPLIVGTKDGGYCTFGLNGKSLEQDAFPTFEEAADYMETVFTFIEKKEPSEAEKRLDQIVQATKGYGDATWSS
jgi:hypothetical protein